MYPAMRTTAAVDELQVRKIALHDIVYTTHEAVTQQKRMNQPNVKSLAKAAISYQLPIWEAYRAGRWARRRLTRLHVFRA